MKPAGVGVLAVVMVPVLTAALLVWIVLFGTAVPAEATCATAARTAGPVNAARIPTGAEVAGFGRTQLRNAAAVVNAAATAGLPVAAGMLGVQAAIGESSLTVLDHGDGAINPDGSVADSIGLFQQQHWWGTTAQRLDPTASAGLFFARLKTVTGWTQMAPTLAINAVQGNADPYYYAPFAAPAATVVAYLAGLGTSTTAATPLTGRATPTGVTARGATTAAARGTASTADPGAADSGAGAGCGLTAGNARQLAQRLMSAFKTGRLVELEPEYQAEIAAVAAGTQSPDCGLDPRILQLIQLSLDTFRTVGISDLNRRCTGSLDGAGTASSHWINGGGQAVDFFMLDGTPLTGGNAPDLQLLHLLDQVVPAGARAGQVECRPVTPLTHLTQFDDTCNHQHIDLAYTDGAPLAVSGSTSGGEAIPTTG